MIQRYAQFRFFRKGLGIVSPPHFRFAIFETLSYCFQETIGFDLKALFASRPESRLIRSYNESGDITKEF